jgi:hypothetical protein
MTASESYLIHDHDHRFEKPVLQYAHSKPGLVCGPVKQCTCGEVKCENCDEEFYLL